VASQHDINSKCCNLVGTFELSQCADCERPALSSVPPTVKAVAAKQSAAFLMSARSEHLLQLARKSAVLAAPGYRARQSGLLNAALVKSEKESRPTGRPSFLAGDEGC
jgi:hypothetical protein